MGGGVCVGVRHKDGSEHVFDRWTNAIPWWMTDPLMMTEGPTLAEFEAGRDGYGNTCTKISGNGLYGVILIDYIAQEILSRQGYCTIPRMYVSYTKGLDQTWDPATAKHLIALYESGRMRAYESDFDKPPDSPKVPMDAAAIVAVLRTHDEKTGCLPGGETLRFEAWMDWSPWKIDCSAMEERWHPDATEFVRRNGWKTPVEALEEDEEEEDGEEA